MEGDVFIDCLQPGPLMMTAAALDKIHRRQNSLVWLLITGIATAAVAVVSQVSGRTAPQIAETRTRVRTICLVPKAQLVFQPKPKYPPDAVKAGVRGTVRLDAVVGKDGSIKKLKIISGEPVLVKAATEAVSQWRYKPTLLAGKPVEVSTEIDVIFELPKPRPSTGNVPH